MDNPIVNVDAEAVEGTVTDMYKMMVRLIRVFADIETVQVLELQIGTIIREFWEISLAMRCFKNYWRKPQNGWRFCDFLVKITESFEISDIIRV